MLLDCSNRWSPKISPVWGPAGVGAPAIQTEVFKGSKNGSFQCSQVIVLRIRRAPPLRPIQPCRTSSQWLRDQLRRFPKLKAGGNGAVFYRFRFMFWFDYLDYLRSSLEFSACLRSLGGWDCPKLNVFGKVCPWPRSIKISMLDEGGVLETFSWCFSRYFAPGKQNGEPVRKLCHWHPRLHRARPQTTYIWVEKSCGNSTFIVHVGASESEPPYMAVPAMDATRTKDFFVSMTLFFLMFRLFDLDDRWL